MMKSREESRQTSVFTQEEYVQYDEDKRGGNSLLERAAHTRKIVGFALSKCAVVCVHAANASSDIALEHLALSSQSCSARPSLTWTHNPSSQDSATS